MDDIDEDNRTEISTGEFAGLTKFRRDILVILAGLDDPKGLRIKEELETYYTDDINHGRLYPNLDALAEQGYIEKFAVDRRSNGYRLTMKGKRHLLSRLNWQDSHMPRDGVVDEEPPDQSTVKPDKETANKTAQLSASDNDVDTNKTPAGREISDQLEVLLDELLDDLE